MLLHYKREIRADTHIKKYKQNKGKFNYLNGREININIKGRLTACRGRFFGAWSKLKRNGDKSFEENKARSLELGYGCTFGVKTELVLRSTAGQRCLQKVLAFRKRQEGKK